MIAAARSRMRWRRTRTRRRVQGVNQSPESSRKRQNVRGRTKADVRDALWQHRAQRGREVVEPRDDAARPAVTQAVGDVVVIGDEGDVKLGDVRLREAVVGLSPAWEAFFLQATDGRMRLDAKLR